MLQMVSRGPDVDLGTPIQAAALSWFFPLWKTRVDQAPSGSFFSSIKDAKLVQHFDRLCF